MECWLRPAGRRFGVLAVAASRASSLGGSGRPEDPLFPALEVILAAPYNPPRLVSRSGIATGSLPDSTDNDLFGAVFALLRSLFRGRSSSQLMGCASSYPMILQSFPDRRADPGANNALLAGNWVANSRRLIPLYQERAAVLTGASHSRDNRWSSTVIVIEQPAMSSDVTSEPVR